MSLFNFLSAANLSSCYYQKKLVDWIVIDENELVCDFAPLKQCPTDAQIDFRIMANESGNSGIVSVFCLQQIITNGAKVLRLNNLDFDAMEQIDLSLQIADYNQPYRAIAVEFPEKYQNKKEVADPRDGEFNKWTGRTNTKTHKPMFVGVVHATEIPAIFTTVYMTSFDAYTMILSYQDTTLEEEMIKRGKSGAMDKSLPISSEELTMYMDVIRASLNACLFADDFGMRSQGAHNPSLFERQQHYLQVAQKSKNEERIIQARRNLRSHPRIYTISQDVKLQVTKSKGEYQKTDRHVEPHWRRGHYRMQRHGPGNSLQKRIRIAPVLVNERFFFGEDQDTSVVLHD